MFSFLNKQKQPICKLTELRQFLDNIPDINRGGCGISAYAMYCYLEKNNLLKEDTYIIYLHDWDKDGVERNQLFLQNKEGCPTSAAHIILYHDGYFLDSAYKHEHITNFEFTLNRIEVPQNMTHIFMKLSLNHNRWNPSFDRKNIKKIEEYIGFKLGIVL
jgi:hypothetical protein